MDTLFETMLEQKDQRDHEEPKVEQPPIDPESTNTPADDKPDTTAMKSDSIANDATTTKPTDTTVTATTTFSTTAPTMTISINVTATVNNNLKEASKQQNQASINTNPLLNDHDYCSPNKNSRQQNRRSKSKQEHATSNEDSIDQIKSRRASSDPQKTTTSSSPRKAENDNHNKIATAEMSTGVKTNDHVDNGASSDSSSSSSSLSSDDSNHGLMIADTRPKSLAPKDTPSVSRNQAGRRSSKNKDLDHQARVRRPRQNTSVTDKSQWITGEDQVDNALSEHLTGDGQREKRQRKEVHDPDFSRFTSSEYSSSDADSEGNESDDNDENDPNRPWCSCNRPHNDEFMICCDICEYWYHGHCVGVTEPMSKKWEKEKKEWFCHDCQEQLDNGTPRHAIPSKIPRKEKKKKTNKTGKRRGRPKKHDTPVRESARLSSRMASRKSSTLESKLGTRRNPSKSDAARNESFKEFEDKERLKELIRERKKAFFFKRNLQNQQREAKMREMGMGGRHSVTAPLGSSLDSLASSTSSPNMNNLPIDIKSDHENRTRPIVLQINTKKEGGVTAVVKSKKRKHSESYEHNADELFTTDPIQISKNSKPSKNPGQGSLSVVDRRGSNGSKNEEHNHSGTASKKKRKDSDSGSSNTFGSREVAQKIRECLESRAKQLKNFQLPQSDTIEKLAQDIEKQLDENFKEGSPKYFSKYRSLIFNFRDSKNQSLVKNVLGGEIAPSRLVKMSSDEMASHELAKWRERENKHSIELIKRDAQLAAQQVIVKKTHKGEEVISAPSLNDPDDPTAEVNNQEPPTTPTKVIKKETKIDLMPANANAAFTISFAGTSTTTPKNANQIATELGGTPAVSIFDTLPLDDTTKEHKNHIFDINCKICTKQVPEHQEDCNELATSIDLKPKSVEIDDAPVKSDPVVQTPSEPKRLRVSIESSFDPTNLSRIRDQPLIKPSERPPESGEYSPSKTFSPNAADDSISNGGDNEKDDDDVLYDPETMLPKTKAELGSIKSLGLSGDEFLWSGSITINEIGKFSVVAKAVSGNATFMRDDINQNLVLCGRIRPEQVAIYFKKLRASTKAQIITVLFEPKSDSDSSIYDAAFDYMYTRNRCGVVENSTHAQLLRDFYLMPIHEGGSLPEILKPINGPGLSRAHKSCIIGLMVKIARPTSALSGGSAGTSSASASPPRTSYTPSTIK